MFPNINYQLFGLADDTNTIINVNDTAEGVVSVYLFDQEIETLDYQSQDPVLKTVRLNQGNAFDDSGNNLYNDVEAYAIGTLIVNTTVLTLYYL